MFSRRGRKKDYSQFFKKDWLLIIGILTSVCLLTLLAIFIIQKVSAKINFSKDISTFASRNEKGIFTLDKMFLFSSCDATRNTTPKALWDLNIFQYTDIAVYINNHSQQGLTDENTIKELWIDHIEYGTKPEIGTPTLYYKNKDEFGRSSLIEENRINDILSYTVIPTSEQLDSTKPSVYNSCQTPITLEFINRDIKTNTIISNTNSLVFDGTLLSRAGITLNSIRTSLSFHINIRNNKDEVYVCNVSLEIPLQDNSDNTILKGNIQKVLENLNHYKFYQLNK